MSGSLPPEIANAVLRMRRVAPFYAVLSLHTEWRAEPSIGTAATDGEIIVYNPAFVRSLSTEHLAGLVAHEVTHMAMRHCGRGRNRDAVKWNIAADIVTNGMVEAMGLKLPSGALRDKDLQTLSVEEVYRRIDQPTPLQLRKLGAREGHKVRDLLKPAPNKLGADAKRDEDINAAKWRDVVRKALMVQRLHDRQAGTESIAALREIEGLLEPQLDWRTLLWRYVIQVPFDYSGWDRRFVHRGIYTEQLDGESLTVAVCLDTSASVDLPMLRALLSELQGIRMSHPNIAVAVYFCDTELSGPHWLSRDSDLPIPVGGGGTSFAPFFDVLARSFSGESDDGLAESKPALAIYLTDGWAEVPDHEPEVPVMWLVPLGERTDFPWGERVPMELE